MFLRPPHPLFALTLGLPGSSGAGGGVAPSAPEIPAGFTATAGNQQIELTWDAQPDADTFEIKFATTDSIGAASVLTSAATGTGITVDAVNGIQTGEKYYFWISATNAAGTSEFSSSVFARNYVTLANAGSVSLQVPSPGAINLNDLLFRSGGALPPGIRLLWITDLFNSSGAGTWEDGINGGFVNPVITGAFTVENYTGSPLTFWDIEP